MILIVMGVSGSGKTTIGSMLANELGWSFYDADDFHSPENREKMSNGIPLTDADREPWIKSLRNLIEENIAGGTPCILACSALKEVHRQVLKTSDEVQFIFLKGDYDLIASRMKNRLGHYMPLGLLKSQLEALEEPVDAFIADITQTPVEIIKIIRKGLNP